VARDRGRIDDPRVRDQLVRIRARCDALGELPGIGFAQRIADASAEPAGEPAEHAAEAVMVLVLFAMIGAGQRATLDSLPSISCGAAASVREPCRRARRSSRRERA